MNNGDLFGHLPVFLKSNAAGKSPNWTHFLWENHLNMGDFPANLVEDDTGSHGGPMGLGISKPCFFHSRNSPEVDSH